MGKQTETAAETIAVEASALATATAHTVVTLRKAVIFMLATGIVLIAAGLTWVYVQSYQGRKEVVTTQRLGCVRGMLDRSDAIGDELDDASFRRDAAAARAGGDAQLRSALARSREGEAMPTLDLRTAVHYWYQGQRAQDRADSKKRRLLGARYEVVAQRVPKGQPNEGAPTAAAQAEAEMACHRAYKNASPWPWAAGG